eukprot:scaffold6610_cov163-Amphora_coffeaeformis.AAC.10
MMLTLAEKHRNEAHFRRCKLSSPIYTHSLTIMITLSALCIASAIADSQSGLLVDYNERFEQLVLLTARGGGGAAAEATDSKQDREGLNDQNKHQQQTNCVNKPRRETLTIWELLEMDPTLCSDDKTSCPTTKRIYQGDNLPNKWVRIHRKTLSDNSLFIQVEDVDESLRAQDHYTAILETSFDGFWDYHIQKDYEYMSPRFWSMFGYRPEEKSHHPSAWQDMIHQEDLKVSLEALGAHVRSHGEVPYIQEARYKHKNGTWVWVLCRGRVIEWGEDNATPVRMVGTHTDITEMKHKQQQEQEFRLANEKLVQERERFAAEKELQEFMGHEIRNPLAAAISVTQFIRDELGAVPHVSASLQSDAHVVASSLDYIYQLITSSEFHNLTESYVAKST